MNGLKFKKYKNNFKESYYFTTEDQKTKALS